MTVTSSVQQIVYSQLREISGTGGEHVFVSGAIDSGDGGHGWFRWVYSGVAGAYADDNGVTIVPTGGDGSAAWVRLYSGAVNVRWFGAKGDGLTDDSAAINDALNFIRDVFSTTISTKGNGLGLVFPLGDYVVSIPLNFTNIKSVGFHVDFQGAVIIGRTDGKPVIDLMGSRWWTFNGLTIIGDSASTPSYGVQHGRISPTVSAGDASFVNCAVVGEFTKACILNVASETTQYFHCKLYNSHATGTVRCLYQDGKNTSDVSSDYVAIAIPPGTLMSFNEDTFYGCDFRNSARGSTIYITGQANRHGFIQCYAAAFDGPICETYDAATVRQLYLDIHAEIDLGEGGVSHVLVVDNITPAVSIDLTGLRIRDHRTQCRDALIDTTGSTYALLLDSIDIEIGDSLNAIPVYGGRAVASKILASGVIKWSGTKNLDISDLYFNGDIYVKGSALVIDTYGSYRIMRRPDSISTRIGETKGTQRFWGVSDDPNLNNYLQVSGSVAGNPVGIAAGGTDADIDIELEPKGSGYVRFGDHRSSEDAQISGYIEIKDSTGIVRKVAVIT